ncbi:MAG: metallophosphoesterase [Ruminococcus sp.]|nr:metallophosphoesterase [Ruminococcus sp.]
MKRDRLSFTKRDIIAAAFAAAVFGVFWWCNNKWLVTSEYTVRTDKLTGDGVTIVQISDLHNASFGAHNGRLMEKIKECEPDIIVITGDIVDSRRTNVKRAVEFCELAAEVAPCYYVDGNHEVFMDDGKREELRSGIEKAGVRIVENKTDTIEINGSRLQIMGLEDEHLDDETQPALAASLDPLLPTVLLAHEPQYFEDYCRSSPELVLCGHAHGGQIRLFGQGLFAPDQGFLPEYTAGAFEDNGTVMIVSRGLGNSAAPLRLFDQPEVVCVRLERR